MGDKLEIKHICIHCRKEILKDRFFCSEECESRFKNIVDVKPFEKAKRERRN
jgi:predicted nucleic acid-binding Zn ribbon protein